MLLDYRPGTPAVMVLLMCLTQLLYFSAAPDAYDGFLRALGIVMATPMPRIPLKKIPSSPTPGSVAFTLTNDNNNIVLPG